MESTGITSSEPQRDETNFKMNKSTSDKNTTIASLHLKQEAVGESDRLEQGVSKSSKDVASKQNKTMEALMEERMRRMEQELTRTLKKRIKKMGKKLLKQQKSMLCDILLFCKEQSEKNDVETANTNQQSCNPSQLPEAPINSIEKFSDFEQKLKCDAKLQNNVISEFLAINCTSPGEYIRICWSKILTDEVAASFSWTIASTKSSICNRLITKTIKKAFALKFPFNQEKFNIVTQKYFLYAKDRTVKLELSNDSSVVNSKAPITTFKKSIETYQQAQPSTSFQNVSKKLEKIENTQGSEQYSEQQTTISTLIKSEEPQIDESATHKGRKKIGQLKNPPKTSAQRSREYRLRKKRSKTSSERQNQSQSNESSTSVPFLDDLDTTNSEFLQDSNSQIHKHDIPENATNTASYIQNDAKSSCSGIVTKIDITDYGFCNQSDYAQSSQTNDDTSQEYSAILYDDSFWKPPVKSVPMSSERKGNGRPKIIPKTSAERSRAYRIRKRIQKAAALQREQLAMECFSNADPLSQNSAIMQ